MIHIQLPPKSSSLATAAMSAALRGEVSILDSFSRNVHSYHLSRVRCLLQPQAGHDLLRFLKCLGALALRDLPAAEHLLHPLLGLLRVGRFDELHQVGRLLPLRHAA